MGGNSKESGVAMIHLKTPCNGNLPLAQRDEHLNIRELLLYFSQTKYFPPIVNIPFIYKNEAF